MTFEERLTVVVEAILLLLPLIEFVAAVIMWRWVRDSGGWGKAATFVRMGALTCTALYISRSIFAALALADLLGISVAPILGLLGVAAALILPSSLSFVWVAIWWRSRAR